MRTSADTVYLDSSAIVKLAIQEAESAALQRYLVNRPRKASCALARVEVVRAVRPSGLSSVALARVVLGGMHLIELTNDLLEEAAELASLRLRSLDAIHLAAARSLRGELTQLVTYDHRMADAARELGLTVDAPGQDIPGTTL